MKAYFFVAFFAIFINFVGGKAVAPAPRIKPSTDMDAEKFLEKFGFLPKSNATVTTISAAKMAIAQDPKFINAIKQFQNESGLKVTGKLDDATKDEMSKPRCGILKVEAKAGIANANGRWNKNKLSYNLYRITNDHAPNRIREAVRKAFGTWSAVVPLDFVETNDVNADIKVGWEGRSHGDGNNFDGQGGVLAHAFYPTVGKVHFDDDDFWAANDAAKFKQGYMDAYVVAVHEIGHAIGIDHISDQAAIMRPALGPNLDRNGNYRFNELSSKDIAAAQAIYGRRNGGITTMKFYDSEYHKDELSKWSGNSKACSNYLTEFHNDRLSSIDTGGACVYLFQNMNCQGERIKLVPDGNCGGDKRCCPNHWSLEVDCKFNNQASSFQLC
uniref:Peptidase metallopeptidase domain-containing protein n=1 Tax=Panagrolaimus superbus TaxID=310955 RepID=A0A914XXW1_9BILA